VNQREMLFPAHLCGRLILLRSVDPGRRACRRAR
jgi:hypothetical protein